MSNTPTQPAPKRPRVSPALVGAGVLVIALGFGLPMLTPSTNPEPRAAEPTAGPTPAPIQPPSRTSLVAALLRLAVGLVVVCGLCVLVARTIGPKAPPVPGVMEVVASIAVAQCILHLVRAGDRRLLIGTDLGGVKAILELPGPAPELPPAPATPQAEAAQATVTQTTISPAQLSQEEVLNLLLRLRDRKA